MTTSQPAARVLQALGETLLRRGGPLLPPLVDGLCVELVPADQLMSTNDRGWSGAFDLTRTPDPGWLGRSLGSRIPRSATVEEARDVVRYRPDFRRGTVEAIKSAAASVLVGGRRVDLFERDGSPWRLRIRVYDSELPPDRTTADVIAATLPQKPVGIVVEVEEVSGGSWDHLLEQHGTWDQVLAEFGVWDGPGAANPVTYHLPEKGTIP